MLSLIVAMDENQLIGKNNALPWHLPADLKFFKKMTMNHTIVMGRKTFESIGKVLPNRRNIILTRDENWKKRHEVESYSSIEELQMHIEPAEKTFIIGGANLFAQVFPYVEEMLITQIHDSFDGDVYFPDFNQEDWKVDVLGKGIVDEKNLYSHTYLRFTRKNRGTKS